MKLRRVGAVAHKEFLHVVRDFRSLAMALLIPVMMLILFGFALTLDVDNVPMAVWDQSGTARSRDFISRFGGSRVLRRSSVRRQLPRPGPRDRRGPGDARAGRAARIRPADRRRPRRPRPVDRRRHRLEHRHHRHRLRHRRGAGLRNGLDGRTEPAPRCAAAANPLGRAAARLVQRRPGIEKLHHSRPDRGADDGDLGDADLADRSPASGNAARWSN